MRWRDLGFLAGGALLGAVGIAQVSAQPIVVSAPAQARPQQASAPSPSTPVAAPAAEGSLSLTRLNDRVMVSTKDHGDSQTVFVFTFDEHGTMKPTPQKLRFYYK